MNEQVKKVMRAMRDESDQYAETARRLAPRGGEIAAGSEHVRAFLRSEILAAYLGTLGRTEDTQLAMDAAKQEGKLIAENWNKRREWQVHIWPEASQSALLAWHRRVLEAWKQDDVLVGAE